MLETERGVYEIVPFFMPQYPFRGFIGTWVHNASPKVSNVSQIPNFLFAEHVETYKNLL